MGARPVSVTVTRLFLLTKPLKETLPQPAFCVADSSYSRNRSGADAKLGRDGQRCRAGRCFGHEREL